MVRTNFSFGLNAIQKRTILLSGLGGFLEFYDFVVYALMANYLAKLFFPTHEQMISLLATFATFSIGYLIRPLGGIIFGHFGDKIGRKKVFMLSVLLMAGSTFLIGLLPSYQNAGIIAPILLIFLRMMQGFSVGGEIPGAITYISETAPRLKGLACGIIFFFIINGITLGSIVAGLLSSQLGNQGILNGGWRLPFLFGGALGVLSYFLRKNFHESPIFQAIHTKTVAFPLLQAIRYERKNMVFGALITGVSAVIVALLFLFTPTYLTQLLHYPSNETMWINAIALFIGSFISIVVGGLADRFNHKNLLMGLCILVLLLAYPIFWMFTSHAIFLLIPVLLCGLLIGYSLGLIPGILPTLFPTNIRYSAVASAYNLGYALFAGLTPLIATEMMIHTAQIQAPAYYLIAIGLIGLVTILIVPFQNENIMST